MPAADPLFSVVERQARAGFLSGYGGLTRDAYALDLRQYAAWCTLHGLRLFMAKRIDIETFRGEMEAAGRARATIARRLCTIAGFYRYAVEQGLLDQSPATQVHRSRLDCESHATTLGRKELSALLLADITAMGTERGHRTLTVLRAARSSPSRSPRTARSLDLGDRRTSRRTDLPPSRHATPRSPRRQPIVRGVARRAGITKPISPRTLRHASITAALDAGVPLRDV